MKRRIIIFAALAASVTIQAAAQEKFRVEIIREIEMPRDQIFDNATLWLADSFRSSKAVIELRDKELGTIIGNGALDLPIQWGARMPITFKLRVDARDNRYRLTFSDVTLVDNFGSKPIESANRTALEPRARAKFEEMAEGFHSYIAAAKQKAW